MSGSGSTYFTACGGSTVLKRVLLAIINAHTTRETEGCQAERLGAAMAALIGPPTRDEQDIEQALRFMVRQRQKDICDVEMRTLCAGSVAPVGATLTVRDLAMLAARKVMGCTGGEQVQMAADTLFERFHRASKAGTAELDYVQEALQDDAVRRILGELAEWDVPSNVIE